MHTRHIEHRRGWRNHHRDSERHGLGRFFAHGRGGRSVRRGNVRFAILSALQDRPMHGYQVIQELEQRTNGRWRPSAGSVYPTLQLLEDEGLLTSEEVEGRRTYSLTDAGRQTAEEHPLSAAGGLETDAGDGNPNLGVQLRSVAQASVQIQRIGTAEAQKAAHEILVDARRRLYRLLADDEAEPTS
ncbi:MAG: helix-turn-helix transcriptional regulator [Chloroflexi bacterium]|nr:helix-turn-helix transcriptional regulator [Chloroflexota bacterium]